MNFFYTQSKYQKDLAITVDSDASYLGREQDVAQR